MIGMATGDLDEVRTMLGELSDADIMRLNVSLGTFTVHYLACDYDAERTAAYERSVTLLTTALIEQPDIVLLHLILALAEAGLGRRDAAAHRAMALRPIKEHPISGTTPLYYLAEVHARMGEAEPALGLLEDILQSRPGLYGAALVHDAAWDPLRDHRRFKALLEPPGAPEAESG